MDAQEFSGPVLVTAAYFTLWYCLLLGLQRGTKYRLLREYADRGETFHRYFGQDPRMLAADRVVINTQEQMVPFLVALWLCAVFVSPVIAAWCGASYVVLRAFYPVLIGKKLGNTQSKRVYVVTVPCYLLVFYMLGSSVWAVMS